MLHVLTYSACADTSSGIDYEPWDLSVRVSVGGPEHGSELVCKCLCYILSFDDFFEPLTAKPLVTELLGAAAHAGMRPYHGFNAPE